MVPAKFRNKAISVFVLVWCLVFHYESLRANYLGPLVGHKLPKVKFLFPPAGWIMFFQVDEVEAGVEVYGFREERPVLIDPHRIFRTRWLGYDNIHRNIMISVLNPFTNGRFCSFLRRKFPEYERFLVVETVWPSNSRYPGKKLIKPVYGC